MMDRQLDTVLKLPEEKREGSFDEVDMLIQNLMAKEKSLKDNPNKRVWPSPHARAYEYTLVITKSAPKRMMDAADIFARAVAGSVWKDFPDFFKEACDALKAKG